MLGAIIGDIVGSRFEWHPHKSKDFELFTDRCEPTDDSYMTIAIANALVECQGDYSRLGGLTIKEMQRLGHRYPNAGYGGHFAYWLEEENPMPYNSLGNGSAMRVSPCAYVAGALEQAIELSRAVTEVTHNHPEGIKGAEAITVAIFMARWGSTIEEIRDYIDTHYYRMNFTLDEIRDSYLFDETCPGSVPESIMAFLESTDYEDAIRNAISLGGDADTQAAIAGSIAEAYYGIPDEIADRAFDFFDSEMMESYQEFCMKYFGECD